MSCVISQCILIDSTVTKRATFCAAHLCNRRFSQNTEFFADGAQR